jgi:hypothetical protein
VVLAALATITAAAFAGLALIDAVFAGAAFAGAVFIVSDFFAATNAS